jgi:hypothetical protein
LHVCTVGDVLPGTGLPCTSTGALEAEPGNRALYALTDFGYIDYNDDVINELSLTYVLYSSFVLVLYSIFASTLQLQLPYV